MRDALDFMFEWAQDLYTGSGRPDISDESAFFCLCCERRFRTFSGLINHLKGKACEDGLFSPHIFPAIRAVSKERIFAKYSVQDRVKKSV